MSTPKVKPDPNALEHLKTHQRRATVGRMKTLALLRSLLALGALGLTACGGGDDDETTAASATPITNALNPYDELAADPADNKSCGTAGGRGLTVVAGDISCRGARRLMHRVAYNRLPYQWRCMGPEGATGGYEVCTNRPGASSRIVIKVHFGRERAPLSAADQKIEQTGESWASAFAARSRFARYMTQPALERLACERIGGVRIENCTPVSSEFQRSFASASVQEVTINGRRRAAAKFSNGETVGLSRFHAGPRCLGSGCELPAGAPRRLWLIYKLGVDAGRTERSPK